MPMMREGTPGMATARQEVGWHGKLPSAGDFMHRRMSREVMNWWDRWLQAGLAATSHGSADTTRRAFEAAPAWNFAVPAGAGGGVVQLGCIVPSHDRVGRRYPVCALAALSPDAFEPALLAGSAEYFRQLSQGLCSGVRHLHAPEGVDRAVAQTAHWLSQYSPAPASAAASASSAGNDIMSILSNGFEPIAPRDDALPWPDLPECFNPHSHTSYWWTSQVDGAPLQRYAHGGAPNASLFATLFAPILRVPSAT